VPRATLLIAARNRAEQFEIAMRTIRDREYKDLDVLVLDDCSSDNTLKIAESFSDVITTYYRLERNGGYRRGSMSSC
jgi:glycosyltransferase involved in cell wall biosynthesis